MNILVPDASIILKWLLPGPEEEDTDKALQIRDAFLQSKCLFHVPTLWYYEVGNTLTRRFPAYVGPLLETVLDLNMEECHVRNENLKVTLDFAKRFNVTFYDAAYHAVAVVKKGMFITADRKYFSKTKSAGNIVLLRHWVPDVPPEHDEDRID